MKQQTGRSLAILKKKKRPVIPRDVVASIEFETLKEVGSKQLPPEFEVLRPLLDEVPYLPNVSR